MTSHDGTDIVMPQMGESIFEGTITKWLKKAGDHVEKDEPLFEISTDKVDAEIPSPVAGILTEIKVPEGATVEINTVVAVIGGAIAKPHSSCRNAQRQPVAAPELRRRKRSQPHRSSPHRRWPPASAPRLWSAASPKKTASTCSTVTGTGSDGRITKDDILRHLSQHGPGSCTAAATAAAASAADAAAHRRPGPHDQNARHHRPAHGGERAHQPARPHRLQGRHDAHRPPARAREGRLRAAQRHQAHLHALHRRGGRRRSAPLPHRQCLARKTTSIHYHQNINLGIAVALEWGLIVPVVRQAEQRSFVDLARTIADLALRARTKKLMPDETGGSTFTLTNAGVFGGEFGTPIINQPESAILAIGGLRKEPVVLTDAEGNDTIAIRSVQFYCLGFDHRLIDGADSGKFMLEFKRWKPGTGRLNRR